VLVGEVLLGRFGFLYLTDRPGSRAICIHSGQQHALVLGFVILLFGVLADLIVLTGSCGRGVPPEAPRPGPTTSPYHSAFYSTNLGRMPDEPRRTPSTRWRRRRGSICCCRYCWCWAPAWQPMPVLCRPGADREEHHVDLFNN
jgi:hypothetical protein